MKLGIIKTFTKITGRTGLKLQKHSPEILMAAGITGIVVGTIMACRATRKLDNVIDEQHDEKIYVEDLYSEGEIDHKEYQKNLAKVYGMTALKVVKLYAPAVTMEVAAIGCVLGAHGIMKKRNVALMAAYKAVEQSFNDYRQRVIEEFGEEKDYDLKHGIQHEKVKVDEDGKKVTKTLNKADPNNISQYARFFDAASKEWQGIPEYDLMFLKSQQNYMNDLLHARGHVFLNEVYDALGLERSRAGAVVGWILTKDGDNYVDFGIFDGDRPRTRAFVNGTEENILLDFNVDGVIYDLIEEEDGFRRDR